MRYLFVLTALLSGLWASSANARQERQIKLVQTVVGISVHDRSGQPFISSNGVVKLVQDQFGRKPWPEGYWATMIVHTSAVESLVPTRFPVDSVGVHRLVWYAKLFNHKRIKIGFYVLDSGDLPFPACTGVRIELPQIGEYPWPEHLRVVIDGTLDERGHILVQVDFPLDRVVVKNLVLMAKSQGQ